MGAVLLYPLYKLGALSVQQYGLFELIQRKGRWIGFHNYPLGPRRHRSNTMS